MSNKSKRSVINEDDYDCLVASKYLKDGLNQKQISDIMRKSEPMISRLINKSKTNGWLSIKYEMNINGYEKDNLKTRLREPKLENEILKKFSGLQKCFVYPSNHNPDISKKIYYKAAARIMKDIIMLRDSSSDESHIILTSWGSTLSGCIDCISFKESEFPDESKLSIYPAIGNFSMIEEKNEPDLYYKTIESSANANARRLSVKCDISLPRPLMTVAILDKTEEEEFKNCAPVFRNDLSLKHLYGEFWNRNSDSREGEAYKAHTLLTSVGVVGEKEKEYLKLNNIDKDSFDSIVGNIIGLTFDKNLKEVQGKEKTRHVIGPSLDLIRKIANQHREKAASGGSSPIGAGTVIFAFDNTLKAKPVRYLAKEKMINMLVLDDNIAKKILEKDN
jgi:DNA-binding transcriptional regulator LsrR (DeoR family)